MSEIEIPMKSPEAKINENKKSQSLEDSIDRYVSWEFTKEFPHFSDRLMVQIAQSLGTTTSESRESLQCCFEAVRSLNPQDGLEGMLTSQMIAVHNLSMEFLRRSMIQENSPEIVNFNINRATKLLNLFVQQTAALSKHRKKGQQKIDVRHVHVHEGGQAIVGVVNNDGGAVRGD